MPSSRKATRSAGATFRRLSRSVGAKLFTLLFVVLLVTLGMLGYANVRLHRAHLEAAKLISTQRTSDIIKGSTSYYMLRNDRAALQHIVETVGGQPTIVSLRVFNPQGRIAFSNNREELNRQDDVPTPGSVIFNRNGERILRIIDPIPNSPSCATAACHAHPASEKTLGALQTDVSLAAADADVRSAMKQFVLYSAIAILITLISTGVFVREIVHKPVHMLRAGTEHLGQGELGVQITVDSTDELGALARSFNQMSRQLHEAQEEITVWTQTLEERVERKTAELSRAHDQMIQAEKLTSLGKLAAVVAHEINNPLSGILTYAKLLRKWIERGDDLEKHSIEMRDALALIESESRRCGEIVRSLLTFARAAPMNVSDFDINRIVRQCIKLVEHKLEVGNIVAQLDLHDLPRVRGDSAHIEQVMLALVMNAIEAMPHEGVLRIATRAEDENIIITVEDNGMGIATELLPRLFEPFVTTKEGTGLGLAISRSIIERHNGRIEVQSEVGAGTTFTISLPAGEPEPAIEQPIPAATLA